MVFSINYFCSSDSVGVANHSYHSWAGENSRGVQVPRTIQRRVSQTGYLNGQVVSYFKVGKWHQGMLANAGSLGEGMRIPWEFLYIKNVVLLKFESHSLKQMNFKC